MSIVLDTVNSTYDMTVNCTNGYSNAVWGVGYTVNPCGDHPMGEQ